MKTSLFEVFSEKQIRAIKDCIIYGEWGSEDVYFGEHTEENFSHETGYCTDDIKEAKNFKGKKISGICSGIAKTIKDKKLDWIVYFPDFWDDGTTGMIFFHKGKLETTKEELMNWALNEL